MPNLINFFQEQKSRIYKTFIIKKISIELMIQM